MPSDLTPHDLVTIDPRPLDVLVHLAAVQDPRAGAVATFVGQVRDHDPEADGRVAVLEYSAHPDAEAILRAIVDDARADPEVLAVAVSHRTGRLEVGDLAIVACVATAHRALAFDVCRELVERVKSEVPIWKRQQLDDGSHTWVGL